MNRVAKPSIARLRVHRNVDVLFLGEFDGARVTGIDVAKNAHAGIAGENALQAMLGIVAPIGHNHHPGVLRKTDADPTTVVN
jgi:hypothetical protein